MKQILPFILKLQAFAGMKLYSNFIGMMAISVFEGIGILLLIPMLGLLGMFDINTVDTPLRFIIEPMQHLPIPINLPLVLAVFIAIIAAQAMLQRNQTILSMSIQQSFMTKLRMEIYTGLLQANWAFFLKKRKSDFNHILTNELGRVSQGIFLSLRLTATLLFTAIQIGIAFWISFPLTAFILVCGAALAMFSRRFVKKSKTLGNNTTHLSRSYMAGITEQLNGIKDIKSNRLEDNHLSWFRTLCRNMETNYMQFTTLQANSQFVYRTASAILIAVFVVLSIQLFQVPPEKLLLLVILFSRLWPRFTAIQSSWEQIVGTISAFTSLSDLQKECETAQEWKASVSPSTGSIVRVKQGIECRNVNFRYDEEHAAYALRDVTIAIPANRMTAIVGSSGAGKSTLIDVLMGLVRPESGQVAIDGIPLTEENLLPFRSSISYVPQEPFLFHASIRENLQLVDSNASEEQMWEALRFSSAAEFIARLPQGLDTVIGDRGVRLSGGERQRIVLARAILRKPSVLVLDEATSALDSENEASIKESLDRLNGTMTMIVIAHRLSTIRDADQVIVLENGEVIQQGGFQQLSEEKKGTFNQWLTYQAGLHV